MLLWAEGFETYGNSTDAMLDGAWADIYVDYAYVKPVITQARTGSHSLGFTHYSSAYIGYARRVLGSPKLIVGAGYGIYLPVLPSSNNDVYFSLNNNANNAIMTLSVQSDGSISVRSGGPGGTLLGVSDSIITAASWNHIEVKTVIDGVVGSIEVRVNGITVINTTNKDLGSTPSTTIGWYRAAGGSTVDFYIDDIFVWDDSGDYNNDFIGPARVLTLFPTGDGSPQDWTPNGASTAYEAVDDVTPDDDTTYIGAANAGDKVSLTYPDLPPEIVGISGIYIPVRARLDDAGIGKTVTSVISNNIASAGDEKTLTTAYTYRADAFEENPDTLTSFSREDVNALIIQIEKTL